MRLVGAALAGVALLAGGGQRAHSAACPGDARLGRVAYLRGTALRLFDLGSCSDRVLVARGASGPVRFVGGGRFVRYGAGWRVPVTGGEPTRGAREAGLRSPDGRLVADVRVERRPGAPTGSQSIGSESIAADGIQVQAIRVRGGRPRFVVGMLHYPDYVAWCNRRLV